MIKKKHMTLCFSLFLALSMFLGQLIPVTAEDNTVPQTEEQTTETAETTTPEPEVTEDVPDADVPDNGEEPPADNGDSEDGSEGSDQGDEDIEGITTDEAMDGDTIANDVPQADKARASIIPVYVYVVAKDESGQSFSKEMLDLLGVSKTNKDGYFAAGTVNIDPSKLTGNSSGKIKNDADWQYILECLHSTFVAANSLDHPNNKIGDYFASIKKDFAVSSSTTPKSGMWTAWIGDNPSDDGVVGNKYIDGSKINSDGTDNSSGTYCWHLDLRFECAKITYLYGNNKLTGNYQDLTEIGSKIFIDGAIMDYEPEIGIPSGYRIVGYYSDPNFTTPWSAINQPVHGMDNKVYVKIVPENDVVIHYVVKEGRGTVTDPSHTSTTDQEGWDSFNPKLEYPESPKGSTAKPAADWQFEGWYSDEDLTNKVGAEAHYTPSEPDDGWNNQTQYTYYAKFAPKTKKIYVQNNITGNAADTTKNFTYHLVVTDKDDQQVTDDIKLSNGSKLTYDSDNKAHVFTLSNGQSIETEPLPQYYSFVVTQQNTTAAGEHDDGYKTSLTTNCNSPSGSQSTNSHGHILNCPDLTEKDCAKVVFKNEKSLTVPTGLNDHDHYLSLFMMSAGSAIILLAMIIGLRRRMSAN